MRLGLAALSLVLAAVPFFLVDVPPCVDLPQHLAQIRLLHDAIGDPRSPYVIQWLTPYSLSYLPLLGLWHIVPPIVAARLHLMLLALLGVAAVHLVAARRDRPPEAAVLASLLVFSHPLYWGFLSFLFGLPIFLGWLLLVARAPRGPAREAALFLAAALVLYFSHALWLAMALAWLALRTVATRRIVWARLLGVAPVLALAALRAPRFHDERFMLAPEWQHYPIARVTTFVQATLGGLQNPVETIAVAAVAAWIVSGLAARPRDRELLGAGAMLAGLYFVLPDKYMNTIYFAGRWLAPGLMLLVLAVAPAISTVARRAAAMALAAGFFAITASSFHAHGDENRGLSESLAALPEKPALLGLDLISGSALFWPRIGMQHFAYGQALRGGTVGFSFAEHAASLVSWRPGHEDPWTPGLEWFPERLQPSDLAYFTHVLVHASAAQHERFAALLDPVTTEGPWRLYRVRGKNAP